MSTHVEPKRWKRSYVRAHSINEPCTKSASAISWASPNMWLQREKMRSTAAEEGAWELPSREEDAREAASRGELWAQLVSTILSIIGRGLQG